MAEGDTDDNDTQLRYLIANSDPKELAALLKSEHPLIKWPGPARGPARRDVDPEALEKLAQLGLTHQEAADFFNVSLSTLRRRFNELAYRRAWSRGHSKVRRALRRKQLEKAMNGVGDTTMLIWLGKQMLEQKNEPAVQLNVNTGETSEVTVNMEDFSREMQDLYDEVSEGGDGLIEADYEVLESGEAGDEGAELHDDAGSAGGDSSSS